MPTVCKDCNEGTRTRMDEAVLEAKDVSPELKGDWQEVQNYIETMKYSFKNLEVLPLSSLVNGIQIWAAKGVKQQFREYEKINLWQLSGSNLSKLKLLISFDGASYTTLKTLSKITIAGKFPIFI